MAMNNDSVIAPDGALPHTVIIGPYRYPVRMSAEDDAVLDEQNAYGQFTGGLDENIRIRQGLTPQRERDALVHECLHAMFEVTGMGHVLGTVKITAELEEAIVLMLSPQIIQFVRQNPALVAYLLAED